MSKNYFEHHGSLNPRTLLTSLTFISSIVCLFACFYGLLRLFTKRLRSKALSFHFIWYIPAECNPCTRTLRMFCYGERSLLLVTTGSYNNTKLKCSNMCVTIYLYFDRKQGRLCFWIKTWHSLFFRKDMAHCFWSWNRIWNGL